MAVVTTPDDPSASQVAELWEDLLAELAATAEQYRAGGWETVELHPGDVTALSGQYGDRVGFDVLVPDDEYRALEAWFDAGLGVDDCEVYRTAVGDVVLLLVVVRDETDRRAVLYPAFYDLDDGRARSLLETVARSGAVRTYLRRLSGDYVELRHDDPDLFAPPPTVDRSADVDVDPPTPDGPVDDRDRSADVDVDVDAPDDG
ncbi:hypothetical protein BRD13_03220 [Halobacteriales archaeon SW_5_70_135]|nr:MAG: hypothetical protein BRD13_03220 [Halobacteriales archaeon SW_5_70_135]